MIVCGEDLGMVPECVPWVMKLLCILPLQDWLALDGTLRHPDADAERINIPANPRHYWRYRMHLNIEQLASANGFNQTLREMIKLGGR